MLALHCNKHQRIICANHKLNIQLSEVAEGPGSRLQASGVSSKILAKTRGLVNFICSSIGLSAAGEGGDARAPLLADPERPDEGRPGRSARSHHFHQRLDGDHHLRQPGRQFKFGKKKTKLPAKVITELGTYLLLFLSVN